MTTRVGVSGRTARPRSQRSYTDQSSAVTPAPPKSEIAAATSVAPAASAVARPSVLVAAPKGTTGAGATAPRRQRS
jgi:hypothetical protein